MPLTGRICLWHLYLNSHHSVCFPGKPNRDGAGLRTKAGVLKVTKVALRVRPPGALATSGRAPSPACDFWISDPLAFPAPVLLTDEVTVSL